MARGLAAAYAYVRKLFLTKRNATRFYATRYVLYLILALNVAAPHRLDIARLVLCRFYKFIKGRCRIGLLSKVFSYTCDKLGMYLLEHCLDLCLYVIKRYEFLLSRYAADQHAGVVLNVLRADLKTNGNTLHLVLAELPAR